MKKLITIASILLTATTATASQYHQRLADAIWHAEGGKKATWAYGIRSVSYKDTDEARRICLNTIKNTLVKYRATRCKPRQSDLECLASRYAPIGADNDKHNKNQHWIKNVRWYMENPKRVEH